MPINISADLPAATTLAYEGIFVMTDERASHQDIRPLKIALLNLMPTKIVTETQILRRLANSPLQVEIFLLQTASYQSKHTPVEHLQAFYHSFDELKDMKLDGLIITGAPVEHLAFEEVDYWDELVEIMEWSKKNVYSTLHICWGAQAALYYHYGIQKQPLKEKMFGVFPHHIVDPNHHLTQGFDDVFYAPHSRHTGINREDILNHPKLFLLCESDQAGPYIISAKHGRQIFVTGHSEYDPLTLHTEYMRDLNKGLKIKMPVNYYPDDDPSKEPLVTWRGHSNLLFLNWLNYYVYQETPYDIGEIRETLDSQDKHL